MGRHGFSDNENFHSGPKLATNKMFGANASATNFQGKGLGVKKGSQGGKPANTRKNPHRLGGSSDEDMEDEFLVGPGSNHSQIKARNFGEGHSQEDEEHYLLMQRERQIQFEVENDRSQNNLAKKRKVRKAAHSMQPGGLTNA